MAGASGAGGGYTLWAWGTPDNGNMGLGNTTAYSVPQQIGSDDDWTPMVSMDVAQTHAIKSDGTLWCIGGSGTLRGDNSTTTISSPVQIGTATNWQWVGGGYQSAYACNTSGELWCWGSNDNGQMGQGTASNTVISSMVQVAGTYWVAAGGGNAHTIALRTDGTIWGWGAGGSGRTWHNNNTNYSSPVQGVGSTEWWKVRSSVNISDGWEAGVETAKGFGYNQGYWHSMNIDENGKLWGCGGFGGATSNAGSPGSPIQVGTDTTWTNIHASGFGGAGINNGTMSCWGGYNFAGERGNGDTTNDPTTIIEWDGTATDVARSQSLYYEAHNSCIIGGTIYFSGANDQGQGGKGNTTNYSSPVQGPSGSSWVKVICGKTGTIGVKKG